jgi:N-glycosylase/DNA lyase
VSEIRGVRSDAGSSGRTWLEEAPIDLDLTLQSGQAFHWVREGSGWLGAVGQDPVYLEQDPVSGRIGVHPAGARGAARYLALDHPLAAIVATFPKDEAMQSAAVFCQGMRILRQESWEALATFITSSMKQVAHIAQISLRLRERFGKRLEWEGRTLFAYPRPEELAGLEEADLRACSLGYRAKNLLGAARMVAEGQVDLQRVARMEDSEARSELCRLPGVGEKVANCALLFGFERLRAFPVDVWIERVIRERYFPRRRKVTAARIREFCATYFGPYGGYAQQYLFHEARLTWKRAAGAARSGGGR